jgi:chromosome segregation ATPase
MDLILKLLKDLYSTVSPVEFVFVSIVIMGIVFVVMRLALKMMIANGGGLFSGGMDVHIKEFSEKLDDVPTKEDHKQAFDALVEKLDELKHHSMSNLDAMRSNATEILMLKRDLQDLADQLARDIDVIKDELKHQESEGDTVTSNLKTTLHQVQDILSKITSQLDKIDEFARAAVPEFRSYHKELSKDISDISKDIALVENTLNSQINTKNSIKLR